MLVGFMAAGKTTVGRILADRLGWAHVDFDTLIRARTGRDAGRIIRDEGEAAFRSLEAAVTRELADRTRVVLSPGGGWGADPGLRAALGPETAVVWLRITPEEAVRRADAEGTDRPLLGVGTDRLERARSLLARREPAYASADIVVDVDGRTPRSVVDEVVRRLESHSGGR